jgi:ribokinase
MKVLTVGGAMIDTIAIIENSAIERMTLMNAGASFLLLEEGRKTEALEVSTHTGGGAINAAVAFARLGLEASTLIKLGEDRRAEQLIARLTEEGIGCDWVLQDGAQPTGASVHVSSHDRNAAVFTFRGANTLLSPADLAEAAFATDLVYIANLSNEAAYCFPEIVRKAKAHQARVAANPGIRQLHDHGRAFEETLPSLDIVSLNRKEASQVLALLAHDETDNRSALSPASDGRELPPLAVHGLKFESRRASVGSFCRALIRRGVGHVVLTDGHDGAFAATGDQLFYAPAKDGPVAGTAGAGDAFAATFSAYIAQGRGPEMALQAATLNAASVLCYVDTQTGLMDQAALEQALGVNMPLPKVSTWSL